MEFAGYNWRIWCGSGAPYHTGPLREIDSGTRRAVVKPDGSTKTVKAVPCRTAAREINGIVTCIGIADKSPKSR